MNILVDDIEEIVKLKIPQHFNTNFRIGILFELLMQDEKISKENKLMQAINLFYQEPIDDIEEALENILWFYKGEISREKTANNIKKTNNEENKKSIFSYEYDDYLIYSAFLEQYKIDLQDIPYLHWWKFKALFEGLNKDCRFVEVMGYRSIDLSKIEDKKERKRLKKLKELYSLPDMRTKEEKEADFGRAFW